MARQSIASMRTLSGKQLDAPEVDAIAQELERLAHAARGASVTFCCGCRSMRIKFVPGRGYQVLTYREDFCIETMFFAHTHASMAAARLDESSERYPVVTSSTILESVSAFCETR